MASGEVGRILVDCGEAVRTERGRGEPAAADLGASRVQEPASPPADASSYASEDASSAAPAEAVPAPDRMREPAPAITLPTDAAMDGMPEALRGADPAPEATRAPVAAEAAASPEDHYRVLGLAPRASREQIERAYQFCREMYGPGSLATYSLLEPQEVEASRARVDEAYQVLADAGQRRTYDEALGVGAGPDPAWYLPEPSQPGPEPVELPEVVTGEVLRRIRETRGVSLRQIANVSKVGVRYFEYIEQDRFGNLPAPVYLRGFLQEYARMVGLDPRRVTESYLLRMGRRA